MQKRAEPVDAACLREAQESRHRAERDLACVSSELRRARLEVDKLRTERLAIEERGRTSGGEDEAGDRGTIELLREVELERNALCAELGQLEEKLLRARLERDSAWLQAS